MASHSSPTLFSNIAQLVFRLELVFLLALIWAAGFGAAGLGNSTVAVWLFALAAAAGEGLVAGASARILFRDSIRVLQWTAGWTAAVIGLLVMGWWTKGRVGVDPFLPEVLKPAWWALLQISISAATVLFALLVWRRSSSTGPEVAPDAGPAVRPANTRPSVSSAPRSHPLRERLRAVFRRSGVNNHSAEVRLRGAEEHRCPYCLQRVEAGDPRGVVVCPICHSRHHRDCWDVTGMCQVPHFHD